ncbi:MAG: TPM domain-containing protein [Eubacteriales bacterium]
MTERLRKNCDISSGKHRSAWARILAVLAGLAFAIAVITGASALQVNAETGSVSDLGGHFTSEELQQLNSECADFSEAHGFEVFILTVMDDTVGGDSDSDNISYIEDYADSHYADEGAVGLLINMESRYYYIDVSGNVPLNVYTDSRQEVMQNDVEEELSQFDVAAAAEVFISDADEYATESEQYDDTSQYYDYQSELEGQQAYDASTFILPAIIAAVVAVIVLVSQLSRHHEKKIARDASGYVVPGSVDMTVHQDIFMNQYVTRVPINTDHDDGPHGGHHGGGTSVHMSSGGHAHSGGGGHF